ncbi:44805_t:CDS:1, partial [Gigaspora margarita]
NDLKKRQTSLGQGEHCTGANDDSKCGTKICRIRGVDTQKCQLTDLRVAGEPCLAQGACQIDKTFCNRNHVCESFT